MRTKCWVLLALMCAATGIAQAAPGPGGGFSAGGRAAGAVGNSGTTTLSPTVTTTARAATVGGASGVRTSGMAGTPRVAYSGNPTARVISTLPAQSQVTTAQLAALNRAQQQRLPQASSAVSASAGRGNNARRSWRSGYGGLGYYYPGTTQTPSAYSGQFLYPGAYGYALQDRNEYSVATNPYFPGVPGLGYGYSSFPYFYALNNNRSALLDGGATNNAAPPNNAPPLPALPDAASSPLPPVPGAAGVGDTETVPGRQLPPAPDSVVEAVQTELARRGYYSGQPDGIAGNATTEALRRFQTDLRLRPTGRVNQATLFALGLN